MERAVYVSAMQFHMLGYLSGELDSLLLLSPLPSLQKGLQFIGEKGAKNLTCWGSLQHVYIRVFADDERKKIEENRLFKVSVENTGSQNSPKGITLT